MKKLIGGFALFIALFWILGANVGECSNEIKTAEFEPLDAQMIMDLIVRETPAENAADDGISYEDAQMLMKIAMAEAESDGVEGKAMVMAVILNRVKNASFPDTIEGVIFEKKQFSPIWDGRYFTAQPDRECHLALAEIEMGNYNDIDALYFENAESSWQADNCEYLYKVGHHRFYK